MPLLADRPLVDGGPAAYVCRGFVCDRPVTHPDELPLSRRPHPAARERSCLVISQSVLDHHIWPLLHPTEVVA